MQAFKKNIVFIWAYNADWIPCNGCSGHHLLAEIHNATFTEVCTQLGNGNNETGLSYLTLLANKMEPDDTDFIKINNLRTQLPAAQITTYSYDTTITVTDPRGITVYYEYDSFGRLKAAKDNNGKVIENYDYNYRSAP